MKCLNNTVDVLNKEINIYYCTEVFYYEKKSCDMYGSSFTWLLIFVDCIGLNGDYEIDFQPFIH